ncbi:hypothetical protein [Streptococcus mutans]|uniref:hypothetical protein n=1 Tax=Streptococcus mutans TaxID=1309 RepID=UPI001454F7D9|nr:hypothetical protein [Streptococcus mutans]MCB5151589.1 hypothetical protein [Streptococcus mutans]NLQ79352.1 hypothetical protein [Streptococcus mutans]
MNAVTLDSMAFDHFETAGEDYFVDIDGSGFVGSIAGGVLGAGTEFTAGFKPAQFLWRVPVAGSYLALGTLGLTTVAGVYIGAREGWGDGGFW